MRPICTVMSNRHVDRCLGTHWGLAARASGDLLTIGEGNTLVESNEAVVDAKSRNVRTEHQP